VSAIKKVVKGIVNFTKKVEKAGHKFVKRYWKQILIAAAIVFTAGIATVGVAGFSSAMAAGGGGFAGFMSAAGSTMVAGTAAIGGSVGIGSGVTASTAGGAFAAAPVMSGVAAGSGLTLGTGAAAQGLGLAASTYAPAATAASAGATSIGTSGLTAGATGATSGGYGAGGYLTAANPAPGLMGTAGSAGGTTGAAGTAATTGITSNAASVATQEAAKKGVLSTVLNSRAAGPLLSAGVQGISGYMQGKQQQQMMEDTRPLSFWGAGARGQGGGSVNSPFSNGESLTHFDGQPNGQQTIGNYVRDPRANLPNGNQWMNNLPNGNQGLMALGWDVNTGQPYDPNNDPNNPPRYN
jgi:hypothetical protein